jgi:hypothetical protein
MSLFAHRNWFTEQCVVMHVCDVILVFIYIVSASVTKLSEHRRMLVTVAVRVMQHGNIATSVRMLACVR